MPFHHHVAVSDSQGVTLVRLLDRQLIDGLEIENLGQELFQLIEAEDRKKLVLDLSSVAFVSSAALGKLIVLHKKMKARNGLMKLCGICPEVRDVFTVTKLNRLFDIEGNAADAIAAAG